MIASNETDYELARPELDLLKSYIDIRRLTQDILHRPFSDAAIDLYTPGDVLELRYPHGWFRVPRP